MQHRCLKCSALTSLPDGQRFNVCPECGAIQAKVSAELQALDDQLRQAPKIAARMPPPTHNGPPRASGVALICWAVTGLMACGATLYAAVTLSAATSKPQPLGLHAHQSSFLMCYRELLTGLRNVDELAF